MTSALRQLLIILGLNAVPVLGFTLGGWNAATTLMVYWFENQLGAILIGARIYLHQRQTNTRGHFRAHIHTTVTDSKGTRTLFARSTFAKEFLFAGLTFTLAHGVFIVLMMAVFNTLPAPGEALSGFLIIGLFEVFAFATDAFGIRRWPFARVKTLAQQALGRVVLVHLALIAGMFIAALSKNNQAFFIPFAIFKLLSDVGSIVSANATVNPDAPPPKWLIAIVNRLAPHKGDFGVHLTAERTRERAEAALDEEVIEPRNTGRRD